MASIDVRERRQIGNTGIYVSPFGFGGSALGHIYGQIDVSSLSQCSLPNTKDTYSDNVLNDIQMIGARWYRRHIGSREKRRQCL